MDEDGLHQLVSDRNQQLVIDFETLASMRYVSQHDLKRILTIIHANARKRSRSRTFIATSLSLGGKDDYYRGYDNDTG